MAAIFTTSNSSNLLATFKKAIDAGHVVTWAYDKDGDFTHTTAQWKNLAWFRPSVQTGQLVMNILKPQNQAITSEVYAIYHGRFIESMLAHCDKLFSNGTATSMPMAGDKVQ